MAKMAQSEGKQERGADAARTLSAAVDTAGEAADAGAETVLEATDQAQSAPSSREQREAAAQSAEEAAGTGGAVLELLAEQTHESVQTATAVGRAVRWDEVLQAQAQFVTGSVQRLSRLNERYLALVRAGMRSMSFPRGH